MKLREIFTRIKTSKYGAFIDTGHVKFVDSRDKNFKFTQTVKLEEDSVLVLLKLVNNSGREARIKSLVVADFELELEIQKVLENKWMITAPPKIQEITSKSSKKTVFLKRDHNPFSFQQEYGYLKDSIVSEWFTKIFIEEGTIFIGATTTKRSYTQIYTLIDKKTQLRINCQMDDTNLMDGESIESEKVRIFLDSEADAEAKFGKALKTDMKINAFAKPLRGIITSFYFKYNYIDQKMFDEQMDALEKMGLGEYLNCICIDAGYCKYWGDWLDTRPRFHDGLENVVKRISKLNCRPCLWMAPLVADPRSKMFKEHKRWFIEDKELRMNVRFTSPVERFVPNMGLKAVDPTNDEYLEYIVNVINFYTRIGFNMFKLDFLYPSGFFNQFQRSITRVQALRKILRLSKNGEGKKNIILTGLSQMSPLVGMADYARISSDIISPYVRPFPIIGKSLNQGMQQYSLAIAEQRSLYNKTAWVNDLDCIVYLEKDPYRDALLQKQVKMVFNLGTSLWFGDDLTKLSTNQEAYLRRIFSEHQKEFG